MYKKLITCKKMLYQAGIAFLSGGVTALINFWQTQEPEVNITIFGLVMVLLKGTENYLKHRHD